ncbi:MAG: MarR family transcriptional regulator [Acidimicrobiia bacterium]|nr:MarR family transcriptional regulator [Acidimicrobiia bacterium]
MTAELLHAVVRRLRRGAQQELAPLGLTWGQLRLLRTLATAGGPLRMGDLARRLGVVARSATSVVDALEAGGFLARQGDPEDRRATRVVLTDAGADVLGAVRRRRSAVAGHLLSRLSAEDGATLRRLLSELVAAGDQPGAGPSSRPRT